MQLQIACVIFPYRNCWQNFTITGNHDVKLERDYLEGAKEEKMHT